MPEAVVAPSPGWRFLAQRIDGSGRPGAWLDTDLPLTGAQVTHVLTGPCRLSGRIEPVYQRLLAEDGVPVLDERRTLIHAQADGAIRASAVYRRGDFDAARWQLECAGMAAQPADTAYAGETSFVGADPLDVVRHVWEHLQSQQASDLGLSIDQATTSGQTVGTVEEPYELNWWSTHNLAPVIDELAKSTPFDYLERHYWNQTRTEVIHELLFGHPRIGTRRRDLRFVFGENIHTTPAGTRDGGESSNHIIFLGAGEGRDMVRAETSIDDGRLRRTVVVEDRSVLAREHAHRLAAAELSSRQPGLIVDRVTVRATADQPLGSFGPGDEVLLQGALDWFPKPVHQWSRIVALTESTDSPDVALQVVRSGL